MRFARQLTVVFMLGVAAQAALGAEYVAYAVDKQGEMLPLPEVLDDLEAKQLMNVRWGEFGGARARIGVLPVDNQSQSATVSMRSTGPDGQVVTTEIDYDVQGIMQQGQLPVDGIEAMLSTVLLNSNRFRVLERTELDDALREQDLGAAGRVAQPSAAAIGKVLGAEYLIATEVTNYEPGVQSSNRGIGGLVGGLGGGALGGLGVRNSRAVVGMNFRLIDAETGEIMFSKQVESVITERGLTFGGAGGAGLGGGAIGVLGGFIDNYTKTPVGQAVMAAINEGVFELVKQVGAQPASGSVVQARGNQVILNLGEGSVGVGEELMVSSKGEELIDPETGISLGTLDTQLGRIRVARVTDKISFATPVDLPIDQVSPGDRVVSTAEPEPLSFGPAWGRQERRRF
ncbi:MAG: CsgG/HfaB family protein [Pseudomonadales bacterium]|jgi:curli biogenesis system outer membrane secretion channel CsgG|nr:CsgG/HfaB family protein [Pseudomonadales bacterium]